VGATVYRSAANFLLIRLGSNWPSASELRDRLIRDWKIVVRSCDSYDNLKREDYIRVAVRTAADNSKLVEAIAQIVRAI
jgi:histidinol-phosphate/aromatic aminotransferase/cobyric acid decarboxylase-like protein